MCAICGQELEYCEACDEFHCPTCDPCLADDDDFIEDGEGEDGWLGDNYPGEMG